MYSLANPTTVYPDYFWSQSLTFVSGAVTVAVHRHRCFQVVIGLNTQFDCAILNQDLVGLKGFVVNQNIPHACLVKEGEVLVSFIEADSYWGNHLRLWLAGKPYRSLDELLDYNVGEPGAFGPEKRDSQSNTRLRMTVDGLFAQIFRPNEAGINGIREDDLADSRLRTITAYIEQNLHQRLTVESIAGQIHLSPDRARHWFTTQTGIPLSQYILWQRIKRVLWEVIADNCSLAEACIKFGFTDQPHFNRLFKQNFGVSPHGLIKGCRLIG